MNRKNWILAVGIAAILAIGIWMGALWENINGDASPYSAVYLSTGDIYFGELHWFPRPYMKKIWFYQETLDAKNRAMPGIAPFSGAFWKPADILYLNRQNIVFWARLGAGSVVAQAIEGSSKLPFVPLSSAPNAATGTAPRE